MTDRSSRSPAGDITRADVVRELRRFAAEGVFCREDLWTLAKPVVRGALRYWGSLAAARAAARVSPPNPRRRWSKERVLAELRELHQRGVPINWQGLVDAGRNDLLTAAASHVGSFTRARDAAGIPPPPRRNASTTHRWDPASVIAEIKARRRANEPLARSRVPGPLKDAAITHFGSYQAAIEAAGIDYRTVALRRRFDDDELLDWLRDMARRHPTWQVDEVYRGGHGLACARRWGSIAAAATAAGIEGWPVRGKPRRLTAAAVISRIRSRARKGEALHVSAIAEMADGNALMNAAMIEFGSWDAAIAAAGLSPQRRHRAWTRDEVIRELRQRRAAQARGEARPLTTSLQQAARRFFGSTTAAEAAAGIARSRFTSGGSVHRRSSSGE